MKRFLNNLLGFLRSRTLAPDTRAASDAQLLTRFTAEHDEEAFAALVCRHGPMVWCVCRRVLGNETDAEDAFQATFLVLARKARALSRQDLLAGWLHGVASRTAIAARRADARRRLKQRQAGDVRHDAANAEMSTENLQWIELRTVLDTELSRLPKRYRTAIVLCDLQGKSRQDAARLLRLAEGTLSSRLARGRRLLARRLSRYAPGVSGGGVATALAAEATAAVPPLVTASTIRAATAFSAAGPIASGVVSTRVAILAEGVLKMMFLSKLKMSVGVLLAVTLVCTGAALFASGVLDGGPEQAPAVAVAAQDRPKPPDNNAVSPDPIRRRERPRQAAFEGSDPTEREFEIKLKEELERLKPDFQTLGREKVAEAKGAFDSYWELFQVGTSKGAQARLYDLVTSLNDWSDKLAVAELEIATNHAQRLAALERHWTFARKAEIIAESNFSAGRLGPQELYPLRHHRIDAEIKLLKAREEK